MATYNTLDPTSNTESDDTYLLMQNGINRLQTKGILSAALDQGQWQNSFDYRINDITRGTDGKRYIALESSGPNTANGVIDPVTGAEGVWFDCTDTLKGEGTASFSDNSDKLDGQHGGFYRDASNLNSGTVPSARLPGATLTQKGVVEKATTSEAESGASDKFPDAAGMIAAISAKSLGTVYQDYTDVSSIRQAGVVYTNTDSAPRFVSISDRHGNADEDRYQVRKNSSSAWITVGRNSSNAGLNVGFIVPPGFQYRANSFATLNHWSELSL